MYTHIKSLIVHALMQSLTFSMLDIFFLSMRLLLLLLLLLLFSFRFVWNVIIFYVAVGLIGSPLIVPLFFDWKHNITLHYITTESTKTQKKEATTKTTHSHRLKRRINIAAYKSVIKDFTSWAQCDKLIKIQLKTILISIIRALIQAKTPTAANVHAYLRQAVRKC